MLQHTLLQLKTIRFLGKMVHITVMRKEETKYCKNTKLCFWYCDTHKLFFFPLLLSCPEYDAWEGNKYTMDVNCRPCWEGSDNGTWTDCVNGFGCHFLLPYLEAQDMIVAGWMG